MLKLLFVREKFDFEDTEKNVRIRGTTISGVAIVEKDGVRLNLLDKRFVTIAAGINAIVCNIIRKLGEFPEYSNTGMNVISAATMRPIPDKVLDILDPLYASIKSVIEKSP